MKHTLLKTIFIIILLLMVTSITATSNNKIIKTNSLNTANEDFDPLVDIQVTVEIQKIRSLEKKEPQLNKEEKIDKYTNPDFFIIIFINDEKFKSQTWRNTKYVYNPDFSVTLDVPDDEEFVNIKIQLWDWNLGLNKLCDISTSYSDDNYRDSYDVELVYSIKTGHWWGDDSLGNTAWSSDTSGYGRLNGCDDGSIYDDDRDCELWFDINQNDYDNDGIPYWTETEMFDTDPTIDDRGRDDDNDGIPIEWEYKWGYYADSHHHDEEEITHNWLYNDTIYNNHQNLDPDKDSLNNIEEYLTSQWGSDPFRRDLFVELDQMEEGPSRETSILPEESKELIRTAFNRRNIVYHLDDRHMGGSDMIPFDDTSTGDEIRSYFADYFLHGDNNNWRRGVFHYGLVIYNAESWPGFIFNANAYQISAKGMDKKALIPYLKKDIVYASAYMHECGHTFGFNPIGGHDTDSYYPWQIDWWKWRPYKSCMNYGYMYKIVDYSDGSRGRNDFDDWDRMDMSWFEDQWF